MTNRSYRLFAAMLLVYLTSHGCNGEDETPESAPFDWCEADEPPDAACYANKRDPASSDVELARAIALRYIDEHPIGEMSWNWEEAVFMYSLVELYRVTGDSVLLDYYKAWMDRHIAEGYTISTSDTCAPATVALALYAQLGDEKYAQVVADALHYLDSEALRTAEGGINHLGTTDLLGITLWLDSLFMFGNLLTRWGELADAPSALDEMGAQFAIFTDLLQSDSGLYVHSYGWIGQTDSDIYWGRGNGWVMAAGYEYLRARRVRGESDPVVAEALGRQVEGAIAAMDDATGLFWIVLNRPGEIYLETSTSALFAYGMARAFRYGLLDDAILPIIRRIAAGVRTRIVEDDHQRPLVTGISGPTTAGTFEYYGNVRLGDDLGYGVGAVILMLIEISGLPSP